MSLGLSFDDVLIEPGYSEVESRSDPVTDSPVFDGIEVPLISANMDTVTGAEMATAMELAGGMGVLHRFMTKGQLYEDTKEIRRYSNMAVVSIGIADDLELQREHIVKLAAHGANALVIDVAHGHTKAMLENVEFIGAHFPEVYLVAGNVATVDGALDLYEAGADAIKVGIGPGAACSTRGVVGVGVPQITAIQNIAREMSLHHNTAEIVKPYHIIADGGIRNTGDFCKAIAAGADAVMAGSIFAGCPESPGRMFEESDMGQYKAYRGMASDEARIDYINGYNDHVSEGISGKVPASGSVGKIVEQYKKALQVSMSYVGASTLGEFHEYATLQPITNAAIMESRTRV